MDTVDCFELTDAQQKAFNRMRRAHRDCIKLGIEFYNSYGTLGALDGKKFDQMAFDDREDEGAIPEEDAYVRNQLTLECGEWADDPHWFHPLPSASIQAEA